MTDARRALGLIRVKGGVRAQFTSRNGHTRGAAIVEQDGYRLRFPDRTGDCEAVIMNTGGGVAAGDHVSIAMQVEREASASATSVGAERIYRSDGSNSVNNLEISVADNASFLWLPHETILFNGARLVRRIDCNLAQTARLTFVDILTFGRRGSGETMTSGHIHDRWDFRRGNALIHAEAMLLEGAIDAQLGKPPIGNGAFHFGTIIHFAGDCEAMLPAIRSKLAEFGAILMAASAWDGKLIIRAQTQTLAPLRAAFAAILPIAINRPIPRGWADE